MNFSAEYSRLWTMLQDHVDRLDTVRAIADEIDSSTELSDEERLRLQQAVGEILGPVDLNLDPSQLAASLEFDARAE